MLLVFLLIVIRFFYIQVVKNDFFQKRSGFNSSRLIKLNPPRGFILDRNGKVIVSNRSTFSILMYPIHYSDTIFNQNLFYNTINNANKRSNLLVTK